MQADVRDADRVKVLAALEGAARLTRGDIYHEVFGRHRSHDQLEALGSDLERDGRIVRHRISATGGRHRRPTEEWQIIKAPSMAERGSGESEAMESPPPAGDGWLPRGPLVRRARRGVMPAHAERVGQRVRRNEVARRKGTGTGQQLVSDEERGATHLITEAINGYRKQGIIEIDGDWIRLVKNPPRRPPHHWHEALLQFLAEGHPTLDGKWHRTPSSLTEAMETALGRRLGPDEQVRRRLGCSGSWHPDDIVLINDEAKTVQTLSEIQAKRNGAGRGRT